MRPKRGRDARHCRISLHLPSEIVWLCLWSALMCNCPKPSPLRRHYRRSASWSRRRRGSYRGRRGGRATRRTMARSAAAPSRPVVGTSGGLRARAHYRSRGSTAFSTASIAFIVMPPSISSWVSRPERHESRIEGAATPEAATAGCRYGTLVQSCALAAQGSSTTSRRSPARVPPSMSSWTKMLPPSNSASTARLLAPAAPSASSGSIPITKTSRRWRWWSARARR